MTQPTPAPDALRPSPDDRLPSSRLSEHKPPWLRIILMTIALAAILVFMNQIGEGAAGCFEHATGTEDQAAPSGEPPVRQNSLEIRPADELP